ncbi:MAG: arylsulfotransferase family protein, partial [Fidelibacterota bacterium]
STRHLSRITKLDYPSGDIIWNLGHEMPSGQVTLGNEIGFSFQHSVQVLENGNIVTFDNGNLAPEFRGTSLPQSRAIEISISQNNADLAWAYELSDDLFGFASGNAQKLANDNMMVTTIGGGGRSLEVNSNGNIVWEANYNLSLPSGAVYRAHRIPGLFPAAYSVMIDNFLVSDENQGVYLPSGSSEISFTFP